MAGVSERIVMLQTGHKNITVLDALLAVAEARGATPTQVALAWQLARPSVTAPIASATSVAQVQELLGAAALKLTPEELAALDVGA